MRDIKWIVLHCTAGNPNQTIESIKAGWKTLGWNKVGYHHLITPDGTDHNLASIKETTNGVAGFNANSIHISYTGGISNAKPIDNRTDKQKETMKVLVLKYMQMFPDAKVIGHRDLSPDKNKDGIIQPGEWKKSCPSFEVKDWLKEENIVINPIMPVVKKVVHTNSGNGVNLRSGSGTHYSIITSLSDGTACIILNIGLEWSKVQVNDKIIGFIKNEYLK